MKDTNLGTLETTLKYIILPKVRSKSVFDEDLYNKLTELLELVKPYSFIYHNLYLYLNTNGFSNSKETHSALLQVLPDYKSVHDKNIELDLENLLLQYVLNNGSDVDANNLFYLLDILINHIKTHITYILSNK